MSRALALLAPALPAMVVVGFFVWFANWIPQIHWDPPRKLQLSADMTPAELAAAGAIIVRERGCLACHTLEPGRGVQGGGRGPNLAGIAERRSQGVPGGAGDLIGYLTEALYEPGAYLVEGYMNIMPASTGAPAKLGYEEVVAVVNYLQSLGGTPSVRVGELEQPAPGASAAAATAGTAPPAATAGGDSAALLTELGCLACHSRTPGEVLLGPALAPDELRRAAAERDMSPEAFVMESIVEPEVYRRAGFDPGLMPGDYGTKLSAAQLKALVDQLTGSGGS